MKTVVAAFPTMAEAERVARDVEELGIEKNDISIIAGNDAGKHEEYLKKPTGTGAAAASAASFGGGVGIVASLIALAIPGVGPVIAGGAMATVLTGLGVGAAAGGLVGAFTNMGVSHEEAPLYEEAVRRGGVVVAVHVNEPMELEVARVMDEHGARDLHAEADVWRASGWSNPHPYPSDSSITTHQPSETVNLDDVKSGDTRRNEGYRSTSPRSNVRSYAYNRSGNTAEPYQRPAIAGEDYRGAENTSSTFGSTPAADTTRTSESTLTGVSTGDTVSGATSSGTGQSGSNQFPVRRGPVHISDDDPAYVFGNRWASDPNYNGRSWTDVEASLRSNWEGMGSGPWESFRDRVRRGFESGAEDPKAPSAPENRPGQRGY